MASWRVGNAKVGRENAGETKSEIGDPCPCQNCSLWPPAVQQAGRESLLNCLSRPTDDPISQETEMNRADVKKHTTHRKQQQQKYIKKERKETLDA